MSKLSKFNVKPPISVELEYKYTILLSFILLIVKFVTFASADFTEYLDNPRTPKPPVPIIEYIFSTIHNLILYNT